MAPRVLLVEDESSLVLTLSDALTSQGYEVVASQNGQEGYELASHRSFDLIILDITLPEKSGFDLCRDLRTRGIETPVLMLTARGELDDKIRGFELGADDYLTKPFALRELLARLEAIRRRAPRAVSSNTSQIFNLGRFRVDLRKAEVRKDGKPVELTGREFQLLQYFIEHPNQIITREELLEKVWGYSSDAFTRTVDVHVCLLRKKLDNPSEKPTYFITVRGVGYRFLPD